MKTQVREVRRHDLHVAQAIDRIAHAWGVEDELDPDFKADLIHHFSKIPYCQCGNPKSADCHYESFHGTPHEYKAKL